MGVYFAGDMWRAAQIQLRCLYCEHPFKERQGLNEHYLSAHEEAFSEEELDMARALRARLEQNLKR
jgi:hypothetical protein